MSAASTWRKPRKPTPQPCLKCGRKLSTGLDGRVAALPVAIDSEPLTRNGALLMIVAGVRLYGVNMRGEIIRRTAAEILAGNPSLSIHRAHDCAAPTPLALIEPEPIKPPTPTLTEGLPF